MTAHREAGIPVVYIDDPVDGEKGIFGAVRQLPARLGVLDSDELAHNLSVVCARLAAAFRSAQEAAGAFDLEEFEVTLDLTAKGEVRLIGSV